MLFLCHLSLICLYSILTVFASGYVRNTADPSSDHIKDRELEPVTGGDPRGRFFSEIYDKSALKCLNVVPTCTQRDPIFYEGLINVALHKKGDGVVFFETTSDDKSHPHYPVKKYFECECIEVRVRPEAFSHVFYVTFFLIPKLSLYIHCCCYDGIEYGGVIGSELDEETLAFREVFTKLKQDPMYESIMKEIKGKYIMEGYQFEHAMRLASIGLQHTNFQVETITDPERTGIKITGKKYIWYIEFDGEGKIIYSVTNKAVASSAILVSASLKGASAPESVASNRIVSDNVSKRPSPSSRYVVVDEPEIPIVVDAGTRPSVNVDITSGQKTVAFSWDRELSMCYFSSDGTILGGKHSKKLSKYEEFVSYEIGRLITEYGHENLKERLNLDAYNALLLEELGFQHKVYRVACKVGRRNTPHQPDAYAPLVTILYLEPTMPSLQSYEFTIGVKSGL